PHHELVLDRLQHLAPVIEHGEPLETRILRIDVSHVMDEDGTHSTRPLQHQRMVDFRVLLARIAKKDPRAPRVRVDNLKKVWMLEVVRIERLLGVAAKDHGAARETEAVERLRYAFMQGPRASRKVENRAFRNRGRALVCDRNHCLRGIGEGLYVI